LQTDDGCKMRKRGNKCRKVVICKKFKDQKSTKEWIRELDVLG
jgi:hypothetical protein